MGPFPRPGLVVWLKVGIWLLGLGPVAWLAYGVSTDGLGANPIEALLHITGRWGLAFLLASLAVTPLRRFLGWSRLIKARRLLGLFAFFYVTLHFSIYLGVDQGFAWAFIVEDIAERPFITVGFAAFVLLIPLAITSTQGWIRRLGRRWRLLHSLVYPAAVLGAIHFYWKVKADTFWPLVAGGILALLLLARVYFWSVAKRKKGGG